MNFLHEFLRDIDRNWTTTENPRLVLKVLGSAALFLQTDYERGTKDGDVLQTDQLEGDVEARLLELAGPESKLFIRHRLYLDLVSRNVPLLPHEPLWHPHELALESFDVEVLDIADVVVSTLKRFNSNDRDDIRAMVEGGYLDHERALARFELVIDRYKSDGRNHHLPVMLQRLNQAERDWWGVGETAFPTVENLRY